MYFAKIDYAVNLREKAPKKLAAFWIYLFDKEEGIEASCGEYADIFGVDEATVCAWIDEFIDAVNDEVAAMRARRKKHARALGC